MNSKRFLILCTLCSLFLCWGTVTAHGNDESKQAVFAIVMEKGWTEYNAAVEGIKDTMEKEKERVPHRLAFFYLDEPTLITRIKIVKPDVIITVGSAATQKISAEIKDIPIVFTMVMDPVNKTATSPAIMVGVSVNPPVRIQLETIKTLLPKARRLGLIYNPAENESLAQEARTSARELGLDLKTYAVKSEREIPKLETLPIDALWLIPDYTVTNKLAILTRLLQAGVDAGIAVIGYSNHLARSGALIGFSADFKDIGRQTAEISIRIQKGEKPPDLKNSVPRTVRFFINKTVASLIGFSLSEQILKKASEVYLP